MDCTRRKEDGSIAVSCHHQLGQNVGGGSTVKSGAAGQGRDARVAGREAAAFGRQQRVIRTSADNDPMIVVSALSREREYSGKGRAGLQRNSVSAIGAVESGLEVTTRVDGDRGSGSRRVRHGGVDENLRQRCRAIEATRRERRNGKR